MQAQVKVFSEFYMVDLIVEILWRFHIEQLTAFLLTYWGCQGRWPNPPRSPGAAQMQASGR